ncbi:uncharacterized protein LOC108667533 [Hyalella azteca]|uniref:Uncharacterized protein LOC108667533 n=1 Tax=Hyalella azteca TaxID=294128 RepID=A0A8B7N822_HYAAZ|nr:uncharacterized protein LOC108667533 [Hyalella azteca]
MSSRQKSTCGDWLCLLRTRALATTNKDVSHHNTTACSHQHSLNCSLSSLQDCIYSSTVCGCSAAGNHPSDRSRNCSYHRESSDFCFKEETNVLSPSTSINSSTTQGLKVQLGADSTSNSFVWTSALETPRRKTSLKTNSNVSLPEPCNASVVACTDALYARQNYEINPHNQDKNHANNLQSDAFTSPMPCQKNVSTQCKACISDECYCKTGQRTLLLEMSSSLERDKPRIEGVPTMHGSTYNLELKCKDPYVQCETSSLRNKNISMIENGGSFISDADMSVRLHTDDENTDANLHVFDSVSPKLRRRSKKATVKILARSLFSKEDGSSQNSETSLQSSPQASQDSVSGTPTENCDSVNESSKRYFGKSNELPLISSSHDDAETNYVDLCCRAVTESAKKSSDPRPCEVNLPKVPLDLSELNKSPTIASRTPLNRVRRAPFSTSTPSLESNLRFNLNPPGKEDTNFANRLEKAAENEIYASKDSKKYSVHVEEAQREPQSQVSSTKPLNDLDKLTQCEETSHRDATYAERLRPWDRASDEPKPIDLLCFPVKISRNNFCVEQNVLNTNGVSDTIQNTCNLILVEKSPVHKPDNAVDEASGNQKLDSEKNILLISNSQKKALMTPIRNEHVNEPAYRSHDKQSVMDPQADSSTEVLVTPSSVGAAGMQRKLPATPSLSARGALNLEMLKRIITPQRSFVYPSPVAETYCRVKNLEKTDSLHEEVFGCSLIESDVTIVVPSVEKKTQIDEKTVTGGSKNCAKDIYKSVENENVSNCVTSSITRKDDRVADLTPPVISQRNEPKMLKNASQKNESQSKLPKIGSRSYMNSEELAEVDDILRNCDVEFDDLIQPPDDIKITATPSNEMKKSNLPSNNACALNKQPNNNVTYDSDKSHHEPSPARTIKPSCSVFHTGRGVAVHVSEEAVAQASRLWRDIPQPEQTSVLEKTELLDSSASFYVPTGSHNISGKDASFAANQSSHEINDLQINMVGNKASERYTQIAHKSVNENEAVVPEISTRDMKNIRVNNRIPVSPSVRENCLETASADKLQTALLDNSVGFKTASGLTVKVNKSAIQKAVRMWNECTDNKVEGDRIFDERNLPIVPASSSTIEVTKNVTEHESQTNLAKTFHSSEEIVSSSGTSCIGFRTARGKSVQTSARALEKAKRMWNDCSSSTEASTTDKIGFNMDSVQNNSFLDKASSQSVPEKRLKSAVCQPRECDQLDLALHKSPSNMANLKFEGFKTAAGSAVSVSEKAVQAAKMLWQNLDETNSEQKPPEIMKKTDKLLSSTNFQTPTAGKSSKKEFIKHKVDPMRIKGVSSKLPEPESYYTNCNRTPKQVFYPVPKRTSSQMDGSDIAHPAPVGTLTDEEQAILDTQFSEIAEEFLKDDWNLETENSGVTSTVPIMATENSSSSSNARDSVADKRKISPQLETDCKRQKVNNLAYIQDMNGMDSLPQCAIESHNKVLPFPQDTTNCIGLPQTITGSGTIEKLTESNDHDLLRVSTNTDVNSESRNSVSNAVLLHRDNFAEDKKNIACSDRVDVVISDEMPGECHSDASVRIAGNTSLSQDSSLLVRNKVQPKYHGNSDEERKTSSLPNSMKMVNPDIDSAKLKIIDSSQRKALTEENVSNVLAMQKKSSLVRGGSSKKTASVAHAENMATGKSVNVFGEAKQSSLYLYKSSDSNTDVGTENSPAQLKSQEIKKKILHLRNSYGNPKSLSPLPSSPAVLRMPFRTPVRNKLTQE